MDSSLLILYASTSGNTEYVVSILADLLRDNLVNTTVNIIRCEEASVKDLGKADRIILASGTWDIGGAEGQLNPHLDSFLKKDCKNVDLKQKPVAIVSLGDTRYYFTSRASEHLRKFIMSHNGTVLGQPLTIINEPQGQEERINKWGEKLIKLISES